MPAEDTLRSRYIDGLREGRERGFYDGKKAGIKEVVEHIQECEKQNPAFYSHILVEKCYWQAYLKILFKDNPELLEKWGVK